MSVQSTRNFITYDYQQNCHFTEHTNLHCIAINMKFSRGARSR